MTQPDWADEIAKGIEELAEGRSAEQNIFAIASELRKARADGFEVGLVDGLRMSHNFVRAREGREPKSENNGGNS